MAPTLVKIRSTTPILAEAAGEAAQTAAVRIGDYAVRYAREGKYGAVIERLTTEAHEALLRFIEEERIDHLGAFVFCPEDIEQAAAIFKE